MDSAPPGSEMGELLKACVQHGASDVLLVPNEPPSLRVDGVLHKMPGAGPLSAEQCKRLFRSIVSDKQWSQFETSGELDSSFVYEGLRYRVNFYVQLEGPAAAFRPISPMIPEPEQLGLPNSVIKMAELPRGLVLVTGPTGSGKSTTLASLIEYVNRRHKKHVITVEDPIEYVYQNKSSIIDQRQVGQHTVSFAQALKYTLRQNPDIILVGEMRDAETVDLTVRAAETGHLCFSTLHTQDAASTIDRMVSEFPPDQRGKICNVLSNVIVGVVCQQLVPRKDGGRVCAREVMVMTPAIATLLRDAKIHQITGAIESGSQEGMTSLDQSLATLVTQGLITMDTALKTARSERNFRNLLENIKSRIPPRAAPPPITVRPRT